MPTQVVECDSSDWALAVENVVSAVIQLNGSSNTVRVHKASSKPDAGNVDGIILQNGQLEEIGISGDAGNEDIYVRSVHLSSSGSAPTEASVTVLY